MKACLCCGAVAPADAISCPKCGESSWIALGLNESAAPSLSLEIAVDKKSRK